MTTAEIETANPCSLSSKINLSRSLSIGFFNTDIGPLAVLVALELPCSIMALNVVDHSQNCFGIMLSALHAPLIDPPASTRLLTFLTIASLSNFVKRLLLLLGVGVVVPIMMDNNVNKQQCRSNNIHIFTNAPKKKFKKTIFMAHI